MKDKEKTKMKDKEKTKRRTGSQLRTEYAMAIFDWCRAYPQGTINELLDLVFICESRVAKIDSIKQYHDYKTIHSEQN